MGGGSSGRWSSLGDISSLEAKAKEALREGRRNVFISFANEDIDEVNLLRAQAKNDNNDIEFNDHSVREPYDSERADYIRRKIAERINRASVCVVYLSNSTSQSEWVKWEVEKSIEYGKKIIVVHPGERFTGKVPKWISENNIRVVPWNQLGPELR